MQNGSGQLMPLADFRARHFDRPTRSLQRRISDETRKPGEIDGSAKR
jgi:hypothetical protein